jgi:cyclophilin family peptidyl-prolyl cis-trans isomerase
MQEGTLGMYHTRGDGNGASSAFFWVPVDRTVTASVRNEQPAFARLNTRFAAFAHIVEGLDIFSKLRPSDILVSAEVKDGAWELTKYDDSEIVAPIKEEDKSLL